MNLPLVSITLVTHNSRFWTGPCLDAVLRQEGVNLEVVVVDNASTDGTRQVLDRYRGRIRVMRNEANEGFCAAQNRAISASSGSWVLALNPDVLMEPDFIRALVEAGTADPKAGSVCGKLLRTRPDFTPFELPRIDSAGMYFTPTLRHFDRGWNELDQGQYDSAEYVFGASAAAALYRREMIRDLSMDGEFFDPDFFAYREDADVAWRGQIQGWRCLYTPLASGWHVRRLTPANRRQVSPLINMHSVKNRFLMRIKNMTPGLYKEHGWNIMARDMVVFFGCLFWEHSSLKAFPLVCRSLARSLAWRRQIMDRRQATDQYISSWFRHQPVAQPALPTGECTPAVVTPRAVRTNVVSMSGS